MSRPSGTISQNTSIVNHPKIKRVQLVGNSLLNGVDVNRLCHNVESTKTAAYTIDEAKLKLQNTSPASPTNDLVVYQLCTNDINTQSVGVVVDNMRELVLATKKVLPKTTVAVSLPPLQRGEAAAKLKAVNALLELEYKDSDILLCHNDNINSDCLSSDGIHLNTKGSAILANNIRLTIGKVLNIQFHGNRRRS